MLETFSDADLDAAGVIPAVRSNPQFVRRGTVLEGADLFDAGFFGLAAARGTDSSIRSTASFWSAPGRRWNTPD